MDKKQKYDVKIVNHSKIDGHICYHLVIETDGNLYKFTKRYSELKNLNDEFKRDAQNANNFPKFPPKKFLFAGEDFIKKRQVELNNYFGVICSSSQFSKLKSFIKFVEDSVKDNKNVTKEPSNKKIQQIIIKKDFKSNLTPFKEMFKPEKKSHEILRKEDIEKEEESCQKIVKQYKYKFIPINHQVIQNINGDCESKYKNILVNENILKYDEEEIKDGNDDNFNLIQCNNDNCNKIQEDIKLKIEEIQQKCKN